MIGIAYIFNNRIGLFVLMFTSIILSVSADKIKTPNRKPSESKPINDVHVELTSTVGEEEPCDNDGTCGQDLVPNNWPFVLPKVACMVFINNSNSQADAVKKTWGKKCTILLFIGDESDRMVPAIGIEGIKWVRKSKGISYMWNNFNAFPNSHRPNLFDWLLIADDNMYVYFEYLWSFLQNYKPTDLLYFGARVNMNQQSFNFGGAGIVLSNATVNQLVTKALANISAYPQCNGKRFADFELGRCLQALGVYPADTRDSNGKHTFLPFRPDAMFTGKVPAWWSNHAHYPVQMGKDCCSIKPIIFGAMQSYHMYMLEYAFNKVRNMEKPIRSWEK